MMKLFNIFLCFFFCLPVFAQNQKEQEDSLVILMSSKSAQIIEIDEMSYRKVVGPARFLHNNTYLLCDTALWNVDTRIIEAWGNVSILQDQTVLTSNELTYLVDEDLAKFRGSVVQLIDKDNNTLRTRHLDYNTKDSVAVFHNGGSMRDKDGQIIESIDGTYESKLKTFTFMNDVNMFTDSIFVKTSHLVYNSDMDMSTFSKGIDVWKDENMLSAVDGWYDKGEEIFFFTNDVHILSEEQEGWSDTLYYYRHTGNVDMLGEAQVTDTVRTVFGMAGRIEYMDSLAKVTMSRDPAIITVVEDEKTKDVDSVYLRADRLIYQSKRKCDIAESVFSQSELRLKNLSVDPVGEYRRKAAEEAAKAAEEAAKNDPNYRPPKGAGASTPDNKPASEVAEPADDAQTSVTTEISTATQPSATVETVPAESSDPEQASGAEDLHDSVAVADSLTRPDSLVTVDPLTMTDSLMTVDSLMSPDSLSDLRTQENEVKDTTKVGFLEAIRSVRVYKKDIQVVCDSLLYSDLDSLVRLFKEPIIWQNDQYQYKADSVIFAIDSGRLDKASFMSNAFVSIQEVDSIHFNQVKGAEMMAYYNDKSELRRFDVLGGSSSLFFLEENGTLATVNSTESKMLSAILENGEISRIYYFEGVKNDGTPLAQMSPEAQRLKDFEWKYEIAPKSPSDITTRQLRPVQRQDYSSRPRTTFKQTDLYFPGYMSDVYRQIEFRDSMKVVRERERKLAEQQAKEQAAADSLALRDSLVALDSLKALQLKDSLAVADSLNAIKDSLVTIKDTIEVADSVEEVLSAKELRKKKREEAKAAREKRRKEKLEAKEARWAELDKKDAEKKAAKEEKRKEKLRAKKRKALKDALEREKKDAEALEKMRQRYLKKYEREQARAAKRRKSK